MPAKGHHIIVIGTSAGGLEALDTLVGQLPTDLPSAIFPSRPFAIDDRVFSRADFAGRSDHVHFRDDTERLESILLGAR